MRLIFRNTKENNFLSINIMKSETYDNLFEKLKNKLKPPISVILIIDDEKINSFELRYSNLFEF